jgi:hypothetical protein
MSSPAKTLQDLIDLAMTHREVQSSAALSRIGKAAGYSITHTTIAGIRNGTYSWTPERATLEAIAYLAGVPFAVAYEAAGLGAPAPGKPFAEQLPLDADKLNARQRDVVIEVIRALIEAQETHRTERPNQTPVRITDTDESDAYLTEKDLNGPDELTPSG